MYRFNYKYDAKGGALLQVILNISMVVVAHSCQ